MDGRRLIEALLGVYVATLLIPTLAVSGWVTVASASLGSILAAALAIAGATALAATTVPDLMDRVASLPVAAAMTLPPLAYVPYMILADSEGTAAIFALVGLLAIVPGIGVLLAAAGLRNRRLRARATEHAVVTTDDDDDDSGVGRVVTVAAAVGIGLIVIAAGAAIIAFDGFNSSTMLFSSLTGLSSLFLLFDNDGHELAVTDEGLRVERSITPWDDLDGYRVTDDEIEIERARWLPSRDFDREEMDDDTAFIDALDEFLPRADEITEPAVATDR